MWQTKLYTLNWVIYMILLAVSTIYVYARLDFVRSGNIHQTTNTSSD